MANEKSTFEERREKRIEIAAKPGTSVIEPRVMLTRDLISYIKTIDRGIGKIQAQIFQPNSNKKTIESASKIIEELNNTLKKSAQQIAEIAKIRFIDPQAQTESQKTEQTV